MAQMRLENEDTADVRSSRPSMKSNSNGLPKPYAEYSLVQQTEIQKLRLNFLRNCKLLKRPPASLRTKGAVAISDPQKFIHFSNLETQMLDMAIRNKLNEIKDMVTQCKSNKLEHIPLPELDKYKLKGHFNSKLAFYKLQDETKWRHWPVKLHNIIKRSSTDAKKRQNFNAKKNRQHRKICKNVKKILESGSVVILINEDVPLGAISVLGKGLGYVPTPTTNVEDTRLDMRLTTNRILGLSKQNLQTLDQQSKSTSVEEVLVEDSVTPENPALRYKLGRKYYGTVEPSKDQPVNDIISRMNTELDHKLKQGKPNKGKQNLSNEEREGLKWLENMTNDNKICIVPADKGGAILLVYPDLLRKKVLEKLENQNIYRKIPKDPTRELHKELYELWVLGKDNGFVTPEDAKLVMGISNNPKKDGSGPTNRPSTLSHYKPGKAYFYPSLKIHKLKKEDLKPGVEPPIRLITALQDGISKRSDVYIANTYLKQLEKDFCNDLLTDSTDALQWLEDINSSHDANSKKTFKAFTFDFKGLYDSLHPNLVREALSFAMKQCRKEWSQEFCKWLIYVISMSLKSSVGVFENSWYEQLHGVPTGGSLCVQLANITVFYVMSKLVYSNRYVMKHVTTIKRYIDDGAGFFTGTTDQYKAWIKVVNKKLEKVGLNIDEFSIEEANNFVPFLDIQFCMDTNGDLQTDLYTKETAARAYLSFGSAHPNHIYSGIVYSQCLRLRKIINCDNRLKLRIEELKVCFLNSGYPKKMVNNISNKVMSFERSLNRGKQKDEVVTPVVRVISTFNADSKLVDVINKHEPEFLRSKSFKDTIHTSNDSSPNNKNLFQFVKKTGTNLKNRLVKTKHLALGNRHGATLPCGHQNCKTCKMITGKDIFDVNGKKVKTSPGNCTSYNIIYLFKCKLCSQPYVGRSTRQLNTRTGEHRRAFIDIIQGREYDPLDNDFSLGIHLTDHGLYNEEDFSKFYEVAIIENCSPKQLEVKEHMYIHMLKSIRPRGINVTNPFNIPMLS